MDIQITSAAIATIISAITSATITLLINNRGDKKRLEDQLDAILKIAVQYPYLESPDYAEKWLENRQKEDEKSLRYELYCTLLFNYLERRCKFYKFNSEKIQADLNVKEWVRQHKLYWEQPVSSYENVDGYEEKFRLLINNYLK